MLHRTAERDACLVIGHLRAAFVTCGKMRTEADGFVCASEIPGKYVEALFVERVVTFRDRSLMIRARYAARKVRETLRPVEFPILKPMIAGPVSDLSPASDVSYKIGKKVDESQARRGYMVRFMVGRAVLILRAFLNGDGRVWVEVFEQKPKVGVVWWGPCARFADLEALPEFRDQFARGVVAYAFYKTQPRDEARLPAIRRG